MPAPVEEGQPDPTALVAVVAHGLLSAASTARGIVTTLRLHGETLEPDRRAHLIERAEQHLAFVCDSLLDLARGVPPEVADALHSPRAVEHDPLDLRHPQVGGPAAD